MSTILTQLGVADETTYGTPVTVDRFFEYNTTGLQGRHGRTESTARRTGQRTARADRYEPYVMGADGPIVLDVPTKGFGFFLQHMLGSVSTGAEVDSNYTHTAIEGTLLGKSFTSQIAKPFNPSGVAQPHTFHGCKLPTWTLRADLDGVLQAEFGVDAEEEDTDTPLAVASYPSDFRVFSFVGASITVDGSQVEMKNFEVSADLGLNLDRRFLRGSSLKKEPVENGMRVYTWSGEAEHVDLTLYDFYRAAARVDNIAPIVATFDGPIAHGGSTVPRLEITLPAARFDDTTFDVGGPEALMDSFSGVALDPGVAPGPVQITYRTVDATP